VDFARGVAPVTEIPLDRLTARVEDFGVRGSLPSGQVREGGYVRVHAFGAPPPGKPAGPPEVGSCGDGISRRRDPRADCSAAVSAFSFHEATLDTDGHTVARTQSIAEQESGAIAYFPVPVETKSSVLVLRAEPSGDIAEHAVPAEGVVFVMRGTGQLAFPDSAPLDFGPGDVLYVGGDVPHSWTAGPEGFVLGIVLGLVQQ
jgi:quercetin dioxygenase-like cupin family protein